MKWPCSSHILQSGSSAEAATQITMINHSLLGILLLSSRCICIYSMSAKRVKIEQDPRNPEIPVWGFFLRASSFVGWCTFTHSHLPFSLVACNFAPPLLISSRSSGAIFHLSRVGARIQTNWSHESNYWVKHRDRIPLSVSEMKLQSILGHKIHIFIIHSIPNWCPPMAIFRVSEWEWVWLDFWQHAKCLFDRRRRPSPPLDSFFLSTTTLLPTFLWWIIQSVPDKKYIT